MGRRGSESIGFAVPEPAGAGRDVRGLFRGHIEAGPILEAGRATADRLVPGCAGAALDEITVDRQERRMQEQNTMKAGDGHKGRDGRAAGAL